MARKVCISEVKSVAGDYLKSPQREEIFYERNCSGDNSNPGNYRNSQLQVGENNYLLYRICLLWGSAFANCDV